MNIDLSIRSKVILTLGVPATCLLLYWLLRNRKEEGENDEDQQTVTTSRHTVIEVKVPSKAVGPLIGRQGANIKKLQDQTGTRICFRDDSKRESGEDRVLVIRGSANQAQEAELLVRKTINEMPTVLTEEIYVPIKALGRIIGRNGDSIRQISRSSNARVYIDRARDEPRDITKKVTITGSREQIDIAKSLIQEKVDEEEVFRAKAAVMAANRDQRNKQASGSIRRTGAVQTYTEKHSSDWEGISTNPSPQQRVSMATNVKDWPNKDYVEVYVSSVADPHHFWVQIISSNAIQLDELVYQMSCLYNTDHFKSLSGVQYRVGDYVAALYEQDNSWYRARVMGVEGRQLDLYFLDYGDSGYSDIDDVHQLRDDFLQLPFQAVHCCLAQIKAKGEDWTEEAVNYFEDITHTAKWKVLMAKRIGTKSEGDSETIQIVQLIDTTSPVDIHISQEMVQHGLAEWDKA